MTRNGGGLKDISSKTNTLSSSPSKTGQQDGIKKKLVFIENTVDSILQNKINKTSSIMGKPVGAMSGTGTTDLHPKVHSVSPRGTVGSSIVGLPNVMMASNN